MRWIVIAFVLVGCASGKDPTGDDDDDGEPIDGAVSAIDAPGSAIDADPGAPDARVPPDANVPPPPPDANVPPPPPDANSGPFCNTHDDCTEAGTCCFTFGEPPGFCVPGTEVGELCIPN